MSERARFWVVAILLVAAVAVCVAVRVDAIQRDLLLRAQEALGAAGIAFYGVEFAGRDAILSGFVASREQAEQISMIVGSVPGVRTVSNGLTVERIVAPGSPDAAAVVVGTLPSLRMQRLGDRLMITGRLPDDDSRDLFLAAATDRFGADSIDASLRASATVHRSAWIDSAATVIDLMAGVEGNGRLSIQGSTAVLFGQVRDRAHRQQLLELIATVSSLTWQVDLVALDGATAGGGGGA